ncbi:hypothetical protein NDU88_005632 [Pleurodeles waltl]|uniref:Uncharacterized protein n=1 Tax=Pleurodeles waltl TaxID=8319 RepID=A0AAV7SMH4_PLEWA|nr:hypothetical protein NDU88_005632 [Pleurodeles waltl]
MVAATVKHNEEGVLAVKGPLPRSPRGTKDRLSPGSQYDFCVKGGRIDVDREKGEEKERQGTDKATTNSRRRRQHREVDDGGEEDGTDEGTCVAQRDKVPQDERGGQKAHAPGHIPGGTSLTKGVLLRPAVRRTVTAQRPQCLPHGWCGIAKIGARLSGPKKRWTRQRMPLLEPWGKMP